MIRINFKLLIFLCSMSIIVQSSDGTRGRVVTVTDASSKGFDVDCNSPNYDEGFLFVNGTKDPMWAVLRTESSFGRVKVPAGQSHSFAVFNCPGGVINVETNDKSMAFYTFDFLKIPDGPYKGRRYQYGGIIYSRDSRGGLQAKPLYYGLIGGALWRTIKQRTAGIDL